MSGVQIEVNDTRTIQVPLPATKVQSSTFAAFVADCEKDGYILKSMSTVASGHQRDPYTVGFKLTYTKGPS